MKKRDPKQTELAMWKVQVESWNNGGPTTIAGEPDTEDPEGGEEIELAPYDDRRLETLDDTFIKETHAGRPMNHNTFITRHSQTDLIENTGISRLESEESEKGGEDANEASFTDDISSIPSLDYDDPKWKPHRKLTTDV